MNGYTEAWCLSFNQHLGRSLLVPADVSRRPGRQTATRFGGNAQGISPLFVNTHVFFIEDSGLWFALQIFASMVKNAAFVSLNPLAFSLAWNSRLKITRLVSFCFIHLFFTNPRQGVQQLRSCMHMFRCFTSIDVWINCNSQFLHITNDPGAWTVQYHGEKG